VVPISSAAPSSSRMPNWFELADTLSL
jgi:hypothetical protein